MRFSVLGPLEAHANGRRVAVASGRQRAFLSVLLIHAGEVVSTDRVVDLLWPRHTSEEAQRSLHVTVSRLRRSLEPERPAGERNEVIATRAPGYVLHAESTDAAEFEEGLEAGRAAVIAGDLSEGASLLRQALALWRGAAFVDVIDETWARPEAQRLEELRLTAIEDRVDAELALERHAALAPELELLASRHPTRERLAAQLMLALYRSGRQADALAAYRASREALVEELGLEPGPGLQRLHAAVLAQDPRLERSEDDRLGSESDTRTSPRPRAGDPERKQVTVLFAGITAAPDAAGPVDPEDLRRIARGFESVVRAGVHRLEGTAERFAGDGVMALFGAPVAHEDHARRACYAALHLQQELRVYAADLRGQGLDCAVRVGLSSGEVVFGAIDDVDGERTAVGDAVGMARHIGDLARPGAICASETTVALASTYFTTRELGELELGGPHRRERVYELIAAGSVRGTADLPSGGSSSTFVGREREMQMLDEALEEARSGAAPVVGVVGEAGVGKSRLCREFADRHRSRGVQVYRVAGQAHASSVPLAPVLEFLRSYFEIGDRDTDEDARHRVASKLSTLDASFEDDLPLVFDFLGLADLALTPERMDPEARQRRLLAFMKRLTRAQSARQATIIVVEDVQWLDSASEVFLSGQVEAAPAARALLVLDYRPEYRADWMSRSNYRQIALAPLAPAASEALLAELLGSHSSLAETARLIRERAQGNPFFIEELVRALIESGGLAPEGAGAVPPTVQAVLGARIDRLELRDKDVLQAAAVIGKEFPGRVLERVVDLDGVELADALADLVAGEFVYEQQPHPDAVYAFTHPLTQEVAYRSQLSERRTRVHAATARAIAELYPARLDERAALLAHHWEAAGDLLEAARWHARGAAWAGTANAAQALVHWARVRELVDALPDSSETRALAVASRTLALHYGWRVGLSLEDSEAAFEEGYRLAASTGDDRARALLVAGYAVVRGLGAGDVRDYARLQREAESLAERSGDPALRVALAPGAYALFCSGDYGEGAAMCDRALELGADDPTLGAGINFACPYAQCHALKGFLLISLGRLDDAERLAARSRRIAHEHGDLEVVGFSHLVATLQAYFAGRRDPALAHAHQSLELAERLGGSWFRANAWLVLSMAEGMHEHWAAALEASERSLTIASEGRTVEGDAWRRAALADAYLGTGDARQACALAADAVAHAREKGQMFNETFANVVLGRALLGTAAPVAAEGAFGRVLELARASRGRAFEPVAHRGLAAVARELGDRQRHKRELAEAQRLFTAIGAAGHAEHLSRELTVAA